MARAKRKQSPVGGIVVVVAHSLLVLFFFVRAQSYGSVVGMSCTFCFRFRSLECK